MNSADRIKNPRQLLCILAYHLDPEAWKPLYADIEAGRYRDFPEAMAKAHKPLRKNASAKERAAYKPDLIVRRLESMLAVLPLDTPEREADIHHMLAGYTDRVLPPPLATPWPTRIG